MRPDPFRICFVCSGNICRSPMAEAVMRELAARAELAEEIVVDSAGTGDWHIGERADLRTLRVLSNAGYDGSGHRARQFEAQWFDERDLVIALDRGHQRTLRSWAPTEEDKDKVRLLRAFDPDGRPEEPDIPDPYYDGEQAFADVLEQVEAACRGLLSFVSAELGHAARR